MPPVKAMEKHDLFSLVKREKCLWKKKSKKAEKQMKISN